MALHEQCLGKTDEWYTPPHIFHALNVGFDMDVASPGKAVTPWIPAGEFITNRSLERDWTGFVWMNPPFGGRNGLVPWLEKFIKHGDGIALVPDRTSAPWWQQFAPMMDLTLFVARKIKFIDGRTGERGKSPAQGTCLFGMGDSARAALYAATRKDFGHLMQPAIFKEPKCIAPTN
jgi:hypothetical protein